MTSWILMWCVWYGVIVSFSTTSCEYTNNRPIVGILAQNITRPTPGINGSSYLVASYVKFLESAGARVVPIPTSLNVKELKFLFTRINGLLLPGGDCAFKTSKYYQHAAMVFKWAIQATDSGDYFPIWGTCQGFQTLAEIVAGTDSIISHSHSWNTAWPLNFTDNIHGSRMFADMPEKLKKAIQLEGLTYNAHQNCVTPDAFYKQEELASFFKVLTLNKDLSDKTFISTIEAYNYPFYAVQWHPEMNTYEFNNGEGLGSNVPHTVNAIKVTQHFANFFVEETRKSRHHFQNSAEEEKYLIYKYQTYQAGVKGGWFDELIYIFN